ncbi:hypothetical protein QL285_008163 [Trifolium repens]|nr:hypothetical protein QL285_008163 [Trifolium repens]
MASSSKSSLLSSISITLLSPMVLSSVSSKIGLACKTGEALPSCAIEALSVASSSFVVLSANSVGTTTGFLPSATVIVGFFVCCDGTETVADFL